LKKIFYYFLVSTLFISMFSLASGLSVSAATSSNKVIEKNEGYYSEAFEVNGVKYFYEDNEEYTISITTSLNGDRIIAYKDKLGGNENEIYYLNETSNTLKTKYKNEPIYTTNIEMTSLQTSDIKNLENIKEKVLNNEIKLEKKSIQDFAEVTHLVESEDVSLLEPKIISNSTTSASKVYQALAEEYGQQYTYKYLSSLTKSGYTGYLYEHMTFGAYEKTSLLFDAATSIGIIATALGTPISGLIGIAAWVSAGFASYELLMPTEFKKWNATVYKQKVVKVKSIYPYRAFYDRHLTAVTGSKGTAVLSNVKRTYKSSDYDSNYTLLSKGIDYYIRYN